MLWITVSACSLKEPRGYVGYRQGTYPFVTSSNPVAGGVTIGSGVGPSKIDKVVGVCKAYTSRVGDGPFPTELFDEVGDRIRWSRSWIWDNNRSSRRVGWFDSVVMRHSRRVSGITNLSLNSIDVLSGLDTVKICVAYDLDGERIDHYPASLEQLKRCKPIYEELPGWSEDITGVRHLDELQKMLAIMFAVSVNWLESAFQPSQSDQVVSKPISLKVCGLVYKQMKIRVGQKSVIR